MNSISRIVHGLYAAGIFQNGQVASNTDADVKTIRGDKITWVKGTEQQCQNIGFLINQVRLHSQFTSTSLHIITIFINHLELFVLLNCRSIPLSVSVCFQRKSSIVFDSLFFHNYFDFFFFFLFYVN